LYFEEHLWMFINIVFLLRFFYKHSAVISSSKPVSE
jgi:hypothetical protein